MMMRSWLDGWRRVLNAPAVICGVFLITLVAALPLTLSMRDAIQGSLGSSLAANQAADGVNYDWWQEFAFTTAFNSQGTSLATTFTPTVIGFGTTLDSFT